ncbi:MAG: hypothetical protein NUW22_03235 [Acidobacteria bacterium]|nr:hypothetical protein [Acidobacteriota bacterium]
MATSPLVGRWTGGQSAGVMAVGDAAGDALSCTNIVWDASDQQDSTRVQGPFTATCSNGIQLAGSALGEVSGDTVTITGTGTGQYGGAPCAFTIASTGTAQGTLLTFPYTATTCLGPFSGTTVLQRSALPLPPVPSVAECGGSGGDAVVECVAALYPSRLAANVSHDERVANMVFLRDRIIERGRCKGMDLAWNLKRGVGPHSIDALAWRTNGGDEVVDIGVGYDDTSRPLELQWLIVAGPPGYDRYTPAFSCS